MPQKEERKMKHTTSNDPWDCGKRDLDPWNSAYRQKRERALLTGKGAAQDCAFDDAAHHHPPRKPRVDRNTFFPAEKRSFPIGKIFAVVIALVIVLPILYLLALQILWPAAVYYSGWYFDPVYVIRSVFGFIAGAMPLLIVIISAALIVIHKNKAQDKKN